MTFWKDKIVVVTGGHGLLGSALVSLLEAQGAIVKAPTRSQVNWESWEQTDGYFTQFASSDYPESTISCVFHLAAKVGGVKDNERMVGDYFSQNMSINTNVLKACLFNDVPKVVSAMSTCAYPDGPLIQYPLTEDQLHNGSPYEGNFGYGFAKRMLDVQSRAYRKQYGDHTMFVTAILNNLMGPRDNFSLEDAHVIPSLIHKIHVAKLNSKPFVEIWGDGSARREFTYSFDAAKLLMIIGEKYTDTETINIGCTKEWSIRQVAEQIKEIIGYQGDLVYSGANVLTGQRRKSSSNAKLLATKWWKEEDYVPLQEALKITCEWFAKHYPNIKGIPEK